MNALVKYWVWSLIRVRIMSYKQHALPSCLVTRRLVDEDVHHQRAKRGAYTNGLKLNTINPLVVIRKIGFLETDELEI